MKKIIFAISTVFALVVMNSCSVEGLDNDPNRPTQVTPDLVLNGICFSINQRPWGGDARICQYNLCNYNYYGNNEYNWGGASWSYTTLKNVIKMEEEAKRVGNPDVNPYSALGKFFRAYLFYQMTMLTGDVPMSEALQVSNFMPKYDSQKEVFKQVLIWLDEANSDMTDLINSGKSTFSGDIYFSNNLASWQKINNAFTLRVLMALSNKENDADLNVKSRFSAVVSNPSKYPLLSSISENMQFVYNSTLNKYPVSPDNYGFDALRYNMSSTNLSILTYLKDPRVFLIAEPAGAQLKAGKGYTDFESFVGADANQDLADMSTKMQVDNGGDFLNGEYSLYNRYRYYRTFTAEPCVQVGYSEMCFNIAEAAHRGWISESASDWYEKGIKASMQFYGISNGPVNVYAFRNGGSPTEAADYINNVYNFDEDAYFNQITVKYAGANDNGLRQIVSQKYLAFFQNSGLEGYFNFRRTGLPAFSNNGPGTGNSGKLPKRFQYPASERTNNASSWKAAVDSQFGGSDDINAEMWLLK
jgi:hypothetical protein